MRSCTLTLQLVTTCRGKTSPKFTEYVILLWVLAQFLRSWAHMDCIVSGKCGSFFRSCASTFELVTMQLGGDITKKHGCDIIVSPCSISILYSGAHMKRLVKGKHVLRLREATRRSSNSSQCFWNIIKKHRYCSTIASFCSIFSFLDS